MYNLSTITDRHRKMLQILNVESIAYHHTLIALNGVLTPQFRRVIQWKENGHFQPKLYQTFPFNPIKDVIKSRQSFYLQNDLALPDKPRPHITHITWLVALWQERDRYAPDYGPKTLSSGILIELFDGQLTVSYKTVSRQIWHEVLYNPTQINPLTEDNFKEVINFHLDHAFKDWLLVKDLPSYRLFADKI